MAYDKIIPITRRLDHCLDYVLDRDKTGLAAALDYIGNGAKTTLPDGQAVLEAAINCTLESAYTDMRETKRRWRKTGGVLGYHIIHSYAPGEVTPMQAHEVGVEFARRLLGGRYEAVVSTHLDREHTHCHIVFNSVSCIDGRKFRDNFKAYFGDIRGVSNEVSREHGLSVIEPEGKGKHYAEWQAEKKGKGTVRGLIREDIDAAINQSFTYQSLLALLKKQGYEIKSGSNVKHTAVKPPGGSRFVRLDSLGDGYTEAGIKARLAAQRTGEAPARPAPSKAPPRRYAVRQGSIRRPPQKLRGFRALYVYYLYFLGIRRPAQHKPPPFPIRQEVTKLRRYQRQFAFLQKCHISDDTQLTMLGDALQAEIDALSARRKGLYERKRYGEDVTAEIEDINKSLRQLRQKLKTCSQIEADIPHVREQARICREWQAQEKEEEKSKHEHPKKRRFTRQDERGK